MSSTESRRPPAPPASESSSPLSGGLLVVLLAAAAVGGLWAWTLYAEQGRPALLPAPRVVVAPDELHRVTPAMEHASAAIAGADVPDLSLPSSDGTPRSLRGLAADGTPIVLVFIKDGCPCSESAQPYYNRLRRAYGSKATFLGVIDRDASGARAWGAKFRASFPILADPELRLMRAFGATNSAFFALIDRHAVARMWPGYSVGILQDASAALAGATGLEEQAIDTSDAPDEPYSGCPYELWEDDPTPDAPSPTPTSA